MVFGLLLSVLVALLHFYLWKRLVKDITSVGRTRRVFTWVFAFLTVLVVATLVLPRVIGPVASSWFAWPGYIWFGLVIYLFLTLAVLELPRLALRGWVRRKPLEATAAVDVEPVPSAPAVNRRVFLARASAVVAGATAATTVGIGMANALGPPDLLRVPVRLRKLAPAMDGFRIAVVSDIHLGPLTGPAHTERIVRMINETSPDLVAIVGDLVDGTVDELGPAAEPLRNLVSREGTFFVTGNHEYFTGDPTAWLRELEKWGVQPLRNENTVIRRGDGAFDLAGVNDVSGRSIDDGPDFDRALKGRDSSRPTVLLAHQPVQVSDAAARGVDLQLSGHTHGGQLWPFHYVVGLQQGAVAGMSTVDGTQLYVTRGAGFWGPPVRVGAPPDITLLSLHGED
jgi:predicted MPP superfamily phosphohydrolase